ncbi:MAG: ATP-binding protein [Verrucomicrobiales bacterium]
MPDTERLVLGPGPATRKLLRAESALQQRVEFESLVYRIQNHFVNLRTSELDWGIEEALAALAEYIRVEQGHCFRVYNHGQKVDHTHEWTGAGQATGFAGMKDVTLDEVFPWAAQRLRRGDGLAIYSVAALSEAAEIEKSILQQQGILSLLLVPMIIRGELVGFLGLASTTREIQWDTDAVSLLKLAGGNIADVFERQRAETAQAQVVSILEATSDLVAIAEKDSRRLVYLNQAGRRMIGLDPDEDISTLRINDIVPPWAADIKQHVCFPTVDAIGYWTGESAVLTRAGHEITVSESITRLHSRGANGGDAYAFIIRDITEQKRMEKEVLDIAEREQSRFGHDLHDGLGQHLTGVQFMAQVLQQKLEAETHAQSAEAAEIATLIKQAVTQTRDLARGLSPVVLQSKSLQDALRDLAAGITRRGQAECETNLDDDIAITNSEAAIQLYRIAQEAVNNALKHGQASTVTISLVHDEAGRIELCVRDNGIGFPEDFQAGLGMGLRVMNYRAGLIGGSLEILQREGHTTVTCSVEEEQLNRQNAAATPAPVIRRG